MKAKRAHIDMIRFILTANDKPLEPISFGVVIQKIAPIIYSKSLIIVSYLDRSRQDLSIGVY